MSCVARCVATVVGPRVLFPDLEFMFLFLGSNRQRNLLMNRLLIQDLLLGHESAKFFKKLLINRQQINGFLLIKIFVIS